MTTRVKQSMIADYFPGMGLPGRDGDDGARQKSKFDLRLEIL